MQDKDSTRSSINKRMNVVHRCIRTPNIVLRALKVIMKYKRLQQRLFLEATLKKVKPYIY